MRPMIGVRSCVGFSFRNMAAFCNGLFAAMKFENHTTIRSEYRRGTRDSASTPPASTRFDRPESMLAIAESSACMPEAQLRITVQPGTFWPHPMRSAATRPMLTSSTEGAAQPRITSSSSLGANAWRIRSDFPAAVARSLAEKGPGRLRDFRNGVRTPSTMYTAFDIEPPMARETARDCYAAARCGCAGRLASARPRSCGK